MKIYTPNPWIVDNGKHYMIPHIQEFHNSGQGETTLVFAQQAEGLTGGLLSFKNEAVVNIPTPQVRQKISEFYATSKYAIPSEEEDA